MCAEVSNKVIRTDTVYEQMGIIYNRRPPNYRQAVERALLGSVVMTRLELVRLRTLKGPYNVLSLGGKSKH